MLVPVPGFQAVPTSVERTGLSSDERLEICSENPFELVHRGDFPTAKQRVGT